VRVTFVVVHQPIEALGEALEQEDLVQHEDVVAVTK
jgi:hypothetical protein